jgi:2-hydroxy-3-keto-5-methylthiopentenyl-1-phosphate phosphatase
MSKKQKRYLFICDFDKTLSFDDSGVILSEKIGIDEETFEEKLVKVRDRNIVQLGGELAQLIVTDPDYKGKVSKKLFGEVAKNIKLKRDVSKLFKVLDKGIGENKFYCYVASACPVEIIKKALKGILPPEHIFGTTFIYDDKGYVQSIERTGAGQGKVTNLDYLREKNKIPRDRIIYVGDGSSDLHVMLHVNAYGGYPIAVSSSPYLGHISKRTVLSDSALSILTPILEDILDYKEKQIKKFFIDIGHTISEWSRVKTDWIALE